MRLGTRGDLPWVTHAAAAHVRVHVRVHVHRNVGVVIATDRIRRAFVPADSVVGSAFCQRAVPRPERERLHRLQRALPLLRVPRERRRHEREHAPDLARRRPSRPAARGEPFDPRARLPMRNREIRLEKRQQRTRGGQRARRRRRIQRRDAREGTDVVERGVFVEVGEVRPGDAGHRNRARLGRIHSTFRRLGRIGVVMIEVARHLAPAPAHVPG